MCIMDRCFAKTAEAAALWRGSNNKNGADGVAASTLRETINEDFHAIGVKVIVVAGEGLLDEAPMLDVEEELGDLESEVILYTSVDVIDGTTPLAYGRANSISVGACALKGRGNLFKSKHEGRFWHYVLNTETTRLYRKCRTEGTTLREVPSFQPDKSPFEQDLETIMRVCAYANRKDLSELCIAVLDRDCNKHIFSDLERLKVQCVREDHGSIALALNSQRREHHIDGFLGRAGSPEGAITAAGICTFGGEGWFKWYLPDDVTEAEQERVAIVGAGHDPNKIYTAADLASGHVFINIASITGIDGWLDPVTYVDGKARVHTFMSRSYTQSDHTGIVGRTKRVL